jgi:hypothetical protein
MEALGRGEGALAVDFDNGRGYYRGRWPEERLEYFHGYDEGFADRVRIQYRAGARSRCHATPSLA